ncbi:MAG: hypothetical protein M1821_000300 [Bathelium mastoideum]|nr:MAG: hypothetical protein M1821_000300 [Bathelium mastoideum]KAI9681049.1 MAG: hypothetical protein M1822_007123 [Bathelium mastoideum]
MRIPFLRSYTAFSSHLRPHESPTTTPDLEKNANANAANAAQAPPAQQSLPPGNPTTLPDRLIKFQNLIGISVPSAIRSEQPQRPAQNLGIYKRTVDHEIKVKFQWKISTWTVNAGYLLQIIVGAALTALGAAGGPSAAVTILGALNTIIAGLLTYLKGQGLPGRLEQHFQLLRTLREHIEERERDFAEPSCPLDVDEEIEHIANMYRDIKQTVQDNMPGTVLPPKGAVVSLMRKGGARGIGGEGEELASRARSSAHGVMAELQEMREKYEGQRQRAQTTAEEKRKEASGLEEELQQEVLSEAGELKKRAGEQVEEVESSIRHAGVEFEKLGSGLRNL